MGISISQEGHGECPEMELQTKQNGSRYLDFDKIYVVVTGIIIWDLLFCFIDVIEMFCPHKLFANTVVAAKPFEAPRY